MSWLCVCARSWWLAHGKSIMSAGWTADGRYCKPNARLEAGTWTYFEPKFILFRPKWQILQRGSEATRWLSSVISLRALCQRWNAFEMSVTSFHLHAFALNSASIFRRRPSFELVNTFVLSWRVVCLLLGTAVCLSVVICLFLRP